MKLTYKEAGVNKEAGYKEVQLIKKIINKTHTEGVLSNIGGFSGLFAIDNEKYNEPVLVSGTDGVGTKLKIAFMLDKHNTIGEDCVAMCVNDILCQGAKPLFFLDYIATGKLVPEKMAKIVEGVANGCVKAGSALIGGETAEMPGFYKEGEYDIAGFGVGIVDRKKIIDGSTIEEGDLIVGLPSSGVHSNGYSLVRKIFFENAKLDIDNYIPELKTTLGEELLKPTRIYTNPLYELIEKFNIKGISHITGGGFYENIPRMLPEGLTAVVNTSEIEIPYIFKLIQEYGKIDRDEMYSTFNMGIGIVFVVKKDEIDDVFSFLKAKDEKVVLLGEIKKGEERILLCHQ
ncbi:phosphoribosylformylglycinamidine cyclo-ligase [Anaerosalibacter massiliensis]|uniref:Phosphoribosylformylglycinamidine cyclo-ligase n=1 Tax=Anaerosalibacter massiliensis TaxID=1347392 RepID=A0A9X2MIB6_9FIRM|nr:phosphoribosylformylglycinamidine cyclo-ligase [Anaerosalibacter massiliensis]MCR2044568.1 phosphoribosylformylglycinamidine cyclo-ligase [Anaerosalibacter massiliensis]